VTRDFRDTTNLGLCVQRQEVQEIAAKRLDSSLLDRRAVRLENGAGDRERFVGAPGSRFSVGSRCAMRANALRSGLVDDVL
jgi:hypothetical protein